MSDDCESFQLDPATWKKLPHDLLERVLSSAPLTSLGRFRAVSKSWNATVVPNAARKAQLSRFMLLYETVFQPGKVTVASIFQHSTSLQHSKMRWEDLELLFPPFGVPNYEAALKACDGGLLVFMLTPQIMHEHAIEPNFDKRKLLVWNPLTRQHRTLALPLELLSFKSNCDHLGGREVAVGLIVNAVTGNYKLVVAGLVNSTGTDKALLYDSECGTWKETASPHQAGAAGSHYTSCYFRSFASDGSVYLLIYYYGESHEIVTDDYGESHDILTEKLTKEAVMKFDVNKEIWTKLQERVPLCSANVKRARRFTAENGESLFIEVHDLLRLDVSKLGELSSMSSAELEQLKGFVKELRQELVEHPYFSYQGYRQGNVFYHLISIWGDIIVDESSYKRNASIRLIFHDISENLFHRCDKELPPHKYPFSNFRGFSPSMTSLV